MLDWCRRSGQAPHPRLREALNTMLAAALPTVMYEQEAAANPDMVDPSELPDPEDMLDLSLDVYPPGERRQVEDAMVQVKQFMEQFKGPADMFASFDEPEGGAGDARALPPV